MVLQVTSSHCPRFIIAPLFMFHNIPKKISLTIQRTLIMMHIDDEHTSLMEPEERPGEQMGDENVVGFVFLQNR